MRNKKGISLIVLIITIIVIIILTAIVILTLSKNNPIESAKEARFKEDVRTYQDELALYISKQYANAGGYWDGNISATNCDEIINYIPSFTKKYEGKFVIENNILNYTNKLDDKEKEYAQSLNVNEKSKLLPEEYQQVEYIESTGTQWIDTGVKTNINNFIVELSYNPTGGLNETMVASSLWSNQGYLLMFYNGYWRWHSGTKGIDTEEVDTSKFNYIKTTSEYVKINNNVYNIISNGFSSNTLKLFGGVSWSVNSISITNGKGKLAYCKIYGNNMLIHNFIPCYSRISVINSDNVQVLENTMGLYDTVEGKFYTNQGTGEFIKGPDV